MTPRVLIQSICKQQRHERQHNAQPHLVDLLRPGLLVVQHLPVQRHRIELPELLMFGAVVRWLHRKKGHVILKRRVSVPMFDIGAKGILWKCDCGRTWAQ